MSKSQTTVIVGIYVQKDTGKCVARHTVTSFLVTFCCLTLILTFLSMNLVSTYHNSLKYTSTFEEFELFPTHLTDPRVQSVKSCILTFPSVVELSGKSRPIALDESSRLVVLSDRRQIFDLVKRDQA